MYSVNSSATDRQILESLKKLMKLIFIQRNKPIFKNCLCLVSYNALANHFVLRVVGKWSCGIPLVNNST